MESPFDTPRMDLDDEDDTPAADPAPEPAPVVLSVEEREAEVQFVGAEIDRAEKDKKTFTAQVTRRLAIGLSIWRAAASDLVEIDTMEAAEIALIQERYAALRVGPTKRQAYAERDLTLTLEIVHERLEKRSMKLARGTVSLVKKGGGIKVEDGEKLLGWAKESAPTMVSKTEPKPAEERVLVGDLKEWLAEPDPATDAARALPPGVVEVPERYELKVVTDLGAAL